MNPPRKPSEILRAIGERIARPEAWSQKAYARDRNGDQIDEAHRSAVRWCWSGSMWLELKRDGYDQAMIDKVRGYIKAASGDNYVGFNDTHTHAEVLAANARAIQMAESEGQ